MSYLEHVHRHFNLCMNLQFYVHLGIHDYKMQSLQRHQALLHCSAYKNLFPGVTLLEMKPLR